jgi:hypothetical protein
MNYDPAARNELHRAMGDAMTRWQYIETGLYLIAHCILGVDPKLSSVVFFQIKSGETKLTLVDRMCVLALAPDTYEDAWKPLLKTMRNHLTVRNAMAHYEAVWFDPTALDAAAASDFPIAITPHHLEFWSGKDGKVNALFIEELRQAADAYSATTKDLLGFVVSHVPLWQQHSATLPPRLQQALQAFNKTGNVEGFGLPLGSPS